MYRSQTIVIGGDTSASVSVLSGIPQRSVLGPLLFFCIHVSISMELQKWSRRTVPFPFMLMKTYFFEIMGLSNYVTVQKNIDLVHTWFKEWG